jgi:hypothetical protein
MLYFISHNEHGSDVVPRAPCCSNADCISQSCSADAVSVHRDSYSILPPVEPFAHETVRYVRHGNESAAEHGLHRWQQGYNQPEAMCEWGHLHLCLLNELQDYTAHHVDLEPTVMQTAHRELVRLCSDGVCASAARYAHLQQGEAASRMRELESALAQLKTLEFERAEAWREAGHDLRGSAHVIANASAVLNRDDLPDKKRMQFSEVLRVGVESLNKLLRDLMDQARLEAGHERRHLTQFDAASLLHEFCEATRPLAAQRNLFLKAEGPDALTVEGDAAKIQRIVQTEESTQVASASTESVMPGTASWTYTLGLAGALLLALASMLAFVRRFPRCSIKGV